MMKKMLALMLALVFALGMTTAFAWTCPNCSQEMSGKFCSECGAKKPANVCPACGYDFGDAMPKFCTECGTRLTPAEAAAAPTTEPAEEPEHVTFTGMQDHGDGTVTLSWTGGKPPYSIHYLVKRSDDYFADRADANTLGQWTVETGWEETSYRYLRLVPGQAYWLVVTDSTNKGRYQVCTLSTTAPLEGYSTSLDVTPLEQKDGSTSALACLPVDTAGLEDDVIHGAKIHLNYSNPGEDRKMVLKLVYTLPNGVSKTDWMNEVTLSNGSNHWMGWDFYDLENPLEKLRDYFGELPEGDTTISVYLDGRLAASAVLPIGRTETPDAVKITGMASQGNGTYLLSWEDNGQGPYSVYFIQRFSEDMEADRQDSRGTGRWRVCSNLDATSAVIDYLIPGVQYWIIVTDSQDNSGVYTLDTREGAPTSSFVLKTHLPRVKEGDGYREVAAFSAAELNAGNVECGFYLDLSYDCPTQDTSVQTLWTITAPNGIRFTTDAFEDTLYESGGSYWDCFRIDWAFERIRAWYGEVLQGEYRLDLYVDGRYADGFPFEVTE